MFIKMYMTCTHESIDSKTQDGRRNTKSVKTLCRPCKRIFHYSQTVI